MSRTTRGPTQGHGNIRTKSMVTSSASPPYLMGPLRDTTGPIRFDNPEPGLLV
jgi:hypothetical protein